MKKIIGDIRRFLETGEPNDTIQTYLEMQKRERTYEVLSQLDEKTLRFLSIKAEDEYTAAVKRDAIFNRLYELRDRPEVFTLIACISNDATRFIADGEKLILVVYEKFFGKSFTLEEFSGAIRELQRESNRFDENTQSFLSYSYSAKQNGKARSDRLSDTVIYLRKLSKKASEGLGYDIREAFLKNDGERKLYFEMASSFRSDNSIELLKKIDKLDISEIDRLILSLRILRNYAKDREYTIMRLILSRRLMEMGISDVKVLYEEIMEYIDHDSMEDFG
jgi:hypothetical protein